MVQWAIGKSAERQKGGKEVPFRGFRGRRAERKSPLGDLWAEEQKGSPLQGI